MSWKKSQEARNENKRGKEEVVPVFNPHESPGDTHRIAGPGRSLVQDPLCSGGLHGLDRDGQGRRGLRDDSGTEIPARRDFRTRVR